MNSISRRVPAFGVPVSRPSGLVMLALATVLSSALPAAAQTSSRTGSGGPDTVTTIEDGIFTYGGSNALPALPNDSPASFQIPAFSLLNLGDGIGAAGSARLNMNSVSFGARFALNIDSDGYLNQNTKLVRVTELSGTGTLKLDNNGFIVTGDGADTVFAGSLIGGLAGSPNSNAGNRFDKQGGSSLTLSGVNTAVTAFYVSGGTLQFATQTSLYNNDSSKWTAANLTISNGATLGLNVGGTGEFTSVNLDTILSIGGTGGLAAGGAKGFLDGSTIALDTTNAAGGSLTWSGSLANANGGSNTVNFTKNGPGTLVLSGDSTYSGATTVNEGTLQVGDGGTTGSIASTSAVQLNGTSTILKLSRSDNSQLDFTITGSGNVEIANTGTGTTIIAGSGNDYTGTTSVTSGNLQVGIGGTGTTGTGATTIGDGLNASVLSGTGIVTGTAGVTEHLVQAAAMISPGDDGGDSNGGLTFIGNLTLADDSSALFRLTSPTLNVGDFGGNAAGSAGYLAFVASNAAAWNAMPVGNHDWLDVAGTLTLGSNAAGLIVIEDNGYLANATLGDVFDLGDWDAVIAASFSSGTAIRSSGLGGGHIALPDLSSQGLAWDTSQFANSGLLMVVQDTPSSVPEPSRTLLALMSVAAMALRRKRAV